jgi:uncharacterized protein (TIGR02145 family)
MRKSIYISIFFIYLSISLSGQVINSNEIKKGINIQRNASYNLEEIKVRWKKAALENCPGVPCLSLSAPGPCSSIVTTPTGPSSASVSFVPPTSDGGSPITGYIVTATSTPSAPAKRKTTAAIITVSGTSSPIVVTGLVFGVNYIFTVVATNAVGTSPVITTPTTVTPCVLNTVSAGSSSPTLAVNTALTNITHSTTLATGIGTSTGLPSGVTASWSANVITISGTPTATGSFSYEIPLTGGCGSVKAMGSITVSGTPACAAAAASTTPTLTVNTVLTNITHATTSATGIGTPTGLPAGVSAAWSGNVITISGTPTNTGTFNYTIPLTGTSCSSVNATGTITVTAACAAAAASTTPTLTVNTVLTNITHSTTSATGIGSASGLPTGVSAAWSGNVITIRGTPTATGTFNYTIPLTGTSCSSVNATGTITVTAPVCAATAASTTPTLPVSTVLTNITHATTIATGIGTASGLPAGVTAAWSGNVITISGTPTNTGTFNYTIPLTGTSCSSVNATGTITVSPPACGSVTSVTDIDGNTYPTVSIGNQCWMSENLKTSRYRNGGLIPNVTDNTAWSNSTIGAWSYYNNAEANNAIYGKLYNWYTTLGDTLCPTGWGVPTDAEWTILTTYLGGGSVAGGKMKVTGTTYWESPNTGATNESGFSALPGRFRTGDGRFASIEISAFFWSATEDPSGYNDLDERYLAFHRGLLNSAGNVYRYSEPKSNGESVRCLRD